MACRSMVNQEDNRDISVSVGPQASSCAKCDMDHYYLLKHENHFEHTLKMSEQCEH
jgi:hypothetical protein